MVSQKVILEFIGFSDADYAGSKTDRKSTSGTCQFLGHMLVSWSSKKQNFVALLLLKLSILLLVVVVLKFYGLDNN